MCQVSIPIITAYTSPLVNVIETERCTNGISTMYYPFTNMKRKGTFGGAANKLPHKTVRDNTV